MNPSADPGSQRFVENLRALQPTAAQLELFERLTRLEQLLRKTYQAFVQLNAQNDRMALELTQLRERLRWLEAAHSRSGDGNSA